MDVTVGTYEWTAIDYFTLALLGFALVIVSIVWLRLRLRGEE